MDYDIEAVIRPNSSYVDRWSTDFDDIDENESLEVSEEVSDAMENGVESLIVKGHYWAEYYVITRLK